MSFRPITRLVELLVHVDTDEGLIGVGPCHGKVEKVAPIITGEHRELLVGEDPLDTERLCQKSQIHNHLLAAVPNGTIAEAIGDPDRQPLFYHLYGGYPAVREGWIDLPQGPGFDIRLDQTYTYPKVGSAYPTR